MTPASFPRGVEKPTLTGDTGGRLILRNNEKYMLIVVMLASCYVCIPGLSPPIERDKKQTCSPLCRAQFSRTSSAFAMYSTIGIRDLLNEHSSILKYV
jgi:hypothetical protein